MSVLNSLIILTMKINFTLFDYEMSCDNRQVQVNVQSYPSFTMKNLVLYNRLVKNAFEMKYDGYIPLYTKSFLQQVRYLKNCIMPLICVDVDEKNISIVYLDTYEGSLVNSSKYTNTKLLRLEE